MDEDRKAFEDVVIRAGKYSVRRIADDAALFAGLYMRTEVDELWEYWQAALKYERAKHAGKDSQTR